MKFRKPKVSPIEKELYKIRVFPLSVYSAEQRIRSAIRR